MREKGISLLGWGVFAVALLIIISAIDISIKDPTCCECSTPGPSRTPPLAPTTIACPGVTPCPTVVYHALPDVDKTNETLGLAHAYIGWALEQAERGFTAIPGPYNGEIAASITYMREAMMHLEAAGADVEWLARAGFLVCPGVPR